MCIIAWKQHQREKENATPGTAARISFKEAEARKMLCRCEVQVCRGRDFLVLAQYKNMFLHGSRVSLAC